jgi:hypothetical protein
MIYTLIDTSEIASLNEFLSSHALDPIFKIKGLKFDLLLSSSRRKKRVLER